MLSDNIKQLRTAKGLSQEELAAALNVVRQTVSKWEKGLSVPDSDMLVQLAHVLDTSVNELLGETPATVANAPKKRAPKWWEITLIVLGLPIWFSLLAAAFAVALSLYIVVWAIVISLWATFGAFAGCAVGGIVGGVIFICNGDVLPGVAMIGASLVCAGVAVFLFFGCKAATKGVLRLTKALAQGIKVRFAKGGAV